MNPNSQATAGPVTKKALAYIKAWAKQFEETGDPNLGLMGELYDQLRASVSLTSHFWCIPRLTIRRDVF